MSELLHYTLVKKPRLLATRLWRVTVSNTASFQFFYYWTHWVTVCKTVRPMLSDCCLPVCILGVLWINGWMDQMPLGTDVGLGPVTLFRWGPSSVHGKEHSTPLPTFTVYTRRLRRQAPTFRPMANVAKRSPMSAIAELLFCHIIKDQVAMP